MYTLAIMDALAGTYLALKKCLVAADTTCDPLRGFAKIQSSQASAAKYESIGPHRSQTRPIEIKFIDCINRTFEVLKPRHRCGQNETSSSSSTATAAKLRGAAPADAPASHERLQF